MKKVLLGDLIVFAGINRLGKTTQVRRLVSWLQEPGVQAISERIKYPIYDLEPTGPRINAYLRGGNPENWTPLRAQKEYAKNRHDYEQHLLELLQDDVWVVAEDYVITGIAWGLANGVPREVLDEINYGLVKPDIMFMFEGKPFLGATEAGHLHETDDELTCRAAKIHHDLGREFDCYVINANQTEDEVFAQIENIMIRWLQCR